jgi:hypothetical protein
MVTGHFLQILEIEVGGCRLSLTRLSASAAASGAVAVAVAVAAVAVAEEFAFAEAYYNIISRLNLSLGIILPRTHSDCYFAWLFEPYHSSPYSYHFDFLASENCLQSYLVVVFVEAFAAVDLAWNANFAD